MAKKDAPEILSYAVMGTLVILTLAGIVTSGILVRPGHYEAETLPRTAGSIHWQLTASWGRTVCGNPGQKGALIFGPYDSYPAGTYTATFYVSSEGEQGLALGKVEVADAKTTTVLAQEEVVSEGQATKRVYTLTYTLQQPSVLEFRAWYYGEQQFCVDRVVTTSALGR